MLKGTRVTLRPIERKDIPLFIRWVNDREVIRYVGLVMPMTLEEEEAWFDRQVNDPRGKVLTIETETGEPIGTVSLSSIDQVNRHAILGIMIGEKQYWNQGYGRDAIQTMLRFAFEDLNLQRVGLSVADFNERGIRCYLRCGFKQEGVLRQHRFTGGRYHDTIMMGVLRDEWQP